MSALISMKDTNPTHLRDCKLILLKGCPKNSGSSSFATRSRQLGDVVHRFRGVVKIFHASILSGPTLKSCIAHIKGFGGIEIQEAMDHHLKYMDSHTSRSLSSYGSNQTRLVGVSQFDAACWMLQMRMCSINLSI